MLNSTIINNFKGYLGSVLYYKNDTINNYVYEITIFLKYLQDNNHAGRYESVLFSSYLKNRGLSRSKSIGTTNNIIKALKSFYNYLYNDGIIRNNIGYNLENNKPAYKIPDVLNCYQLYCIFECFNIDTETDIRNAAIIETLYSTGCRVTELIEMKKAVYKDPNSSVIGKNDTERMVIFNSMAVKRIETYLQKRKIDSEYLFTNLHGKKLSRKYINAMIENVCTKAEIPFKVTAHTFRHTFATHLLEGGANIIQVKELLGHKTVATTEIYSHFMRVEVLRKELQSKHPRW